MRSGFEVSSGYSTAMTSTGPPGPLFLALAIVFSWVLLIVALFRIRDRAWPIAFAFLAPLFLVFKHSFVREPLHMGMIFTFVPLLWAVVLLFSEAGRRQLPQLLPSVSIVAAVMLVALGRPDDIPWRIPLAADRLPMEITSAIGSRPVAIFPYECVYAPVNGLNFRPFPVLQAYSAYTPYLDGLDAAFLEDSRSAPPFILFDWKSIDGRHPLLDVPATTVAMYRHYDLEASAGGHLVLRRRRAPRFGPARPVATRQLFIGRPFLIPASRHPLIARIHLELTPAGKLRELVFRIPEVTMAGFRVPPKVMKDGVPLNFLPRDLKDVEALFAGEAIPSDSGDAFTIAGAGSRFFRDPVKVDILEIPEIDLRSLPPISAFCHASTPVGRER